MMLEDKIVEKLLEKIEKEIKTCEQLLINYDPYEVGIEQYQRAVTIKETLRLVIFNIEQSKKEVIKEENQ